MNALVTDHRPPFADLKRDGWRALSAGAVVCAGLALALHQAHGLDWRQAAGALALFAAMGAVGMRWLPAHLPNRALGVATRLTVLRAAVSANLGALLLAEAPVAGWSVPTLAAAALALDAADGWAARRFAFASPFGARIDRELDALTVAILSALVWQAGVAGPWVLLAGAWRYLFLLLGRARPRFAAPLASSRRRAWICGIAVGLLIGALVPALPAPIPLTAAGVSVALLSISFLTDIVSLARRSDAASSPADPASNRRRTE